MVVMVKDRLSDRRRSCQVTNTQHADIQARSITQADTVIHRILIDLDGSELAESALPCAQTLAHAARAELLLVRAAPADEVTDPLDQVNRH